MYFSGVRFMSTRKSIKELVLDDSAPEHEWDGQQISAIGDSELSFFFKEGWPFKW